MFNKYPKVLRDRVAAVNIPAHVTACPGVMVKIKAKEPVKADPCINEAIERVFGKPMSGGFYD